MAVIEKVRRGKRVLVIEIRYRQADGTIARLRRDSKAPTKSAAREEEKRMLDRIARTGSPYEPKAEPETPTEAPNVLTFGDVVEKYRASFMLTDLKVTTRRGYDTVLGTFLIPRFGALPVTAVDGEAACALDLDLSTGQKLERPNKKRKAESAKRKAKQRTEERPPTAKEPREGGDAKGKRTRATRNNVQIVLRSVLRFAKEKGYLSAIPSGLPRLKKVEQTILEIPTDAQVHVLLERATEQQRRAFALMADAGLRPNEVRAVRRRDLQLRWDNGEPIGGFLAIREGRSFGETDTPKTGRREIPIAPRLARLLAPVAEGKREGYLALTKEGEPWGQYGLDQAFERVRNRVGLSGWSLYSLRHYAITSWLRRGIPIHVVQKMAGHKHLSTTQRYVHFLKADLEDAARLLGGEGNMRATGSGASPTIPGEGNMRATGSARGSSKADKAA